VNQLFGVFRLFAAMQGQARWLHPGVVGLVRLVFLCMLSWHWGACAFWQMARADDDGTVVASGEQWVPQLAEVLERGRFNEAYSHSFFFSVVVTTGVGWDIIPSNPTQVAFTSCMIVLGLMLFALMVGSASGALASFNASLAKRRAVFQAVNSHLRHHRVPLELQERIRAFLAYSWASGGGSAGANDVAELSTLPPALRTELSLAVNNDLINEVPMFKGLTLTVKEAVISTVRRRVYLPEETIIAEGSTADTFYVLYRGSVAVEKGGEQLGTLSDGAFFGEIALMGSRGSETVRRTASCIAKTYCDVCTISREDFHRIATRFPELEDAIKKTADGDDESSATPESHGKRSSLVRLQSAVRKVAGSIPANLAGGLRLSLATPSSPARSIAAVHPAIEESGADDDADAVLCLEDPSAVDMAAVEDELLSFSRRETAQSAAGRFAAQIEGNVPTEL